MSSATPPLITYNLPDWFPLDQINWHAFFSTCDSRAILFLDAHWDVVKAEIDAAGAWSALCRHPHVLPFLEKHWDEVRDKIDWEALSTRGIERGDGRRNRPGLLSFLEKHWVVDVPKGELNWRHLCGRYDILPFLEAHWHEVRPHIDLYQLCRNPRAVPLLDKYWHELRADICAKHCWNALFDNASPDAFPLVQKHVSDYELVRMVCADVQLQHSLLRNPHALAFIETHLGDIPIDWATLSANRGLLRAGGDSSSSAMELDADADADADNNVDNAISNLNSWL